MREYAWLTAASARSGVHKPDQVFAFADEAGREEPISEGADRFSGILLDLRPLAYVQCCQEYLPPSNASAAVGRLDMLSSDAFAYHLLSVFDEAGLTPYQVVINELDFHDQTPRRVCVKGCSDFQRILVSASRAVQGAAGDDADGEGNDGNDDDGPASVPDGNSAPVADGFDFLALLDPEADRGSSSTAAARSRKRRKTTPASRDDQRPEPEANDADYLVACVGKVL